MIYWWMEDFDKAKKFVEELIANDYDEKDGKELLLKIATTQKSLVDAKEPTRHFQRNLERTGAGMSITYKPMKAFKKTESFKDATTPTSVSIQVAKGVFYSNDGSSHTWPVWINRDKSSEICFAANRNVTVVSWSKDSVVSKSYLTPQNYARFEIDSKKYVILPYDPSQLVGGDRPQHELFKEVHIGSDIGLYKYLSTSPEIACGSDLDIYVLYKKGNFSAATARDFLGYKKKKLVEYVSDKPEISTKIASGELPIKNIEDLKKIVDLYNQK